MLQVHSFFNTAELERLKREGKLPASVSLGTIQKYMSGGDAVLMLFRCDRTWDVKAILISVPRDDVKNQRKIISAFCATKELPSEAFYHHLESNNFADAEIHIPSSSSLDGDYPIWVVYRHVQQALGKADLMLVHTTDEVNEAITLLVEKEKRVKTEVWVKRPAIVEAGANLRGLVVLGYLTRKFVYAISQ